MTITMYGIQLAGSFLEAMADSIVNFYFYL